MLCYLYSTYIDPGGVERAFVCDAGGDLLVSRERAVCQQAPSFVNDSFHHWNWQAQGGGNRQETCQEAEDQQDPLLQGQHGTSVWVSESTTLDAVCERHFSSQQIEIPSSQQSDNRYPIFEWMPYLHLRVGFLFISYHLRCVYIHTHTHTRSQTEGRFQQESTDDICKCWRGGRTYLPGSCSSCFWTRQWQLFHLIFPKGHRKSSIKKRRRRSLITDTEETTRPPKNALNHHMLLNINVLHAYIEFSHHLPPSLPQ